MQFSTPIRWVATAGLLTWASFGHTTQAQGHRPPPTAHQLAPRQAATATALAAPPTDYGSRLGGQLRQLYRQQANSAGRSATSLSTTLRTDFPQLKFDKNATAVLVRITAQDVNALRPNLASRGFREVAAYPNLHFVEGMLPLSQLAPGSQGIQGLVPQGLLGVLPSLKPQVRGGRVTSQADYALEAARVRATRPGLLTGKGVRIGVMSDSFNSLNGAADVAADDLPAGVQVLQDLSDEEGGTDEGRAMAQLIYDLAPGAGLAFSSVYLGEGDFARQIINLADPAKGNCQVLVDDIAYFGEPFFQDGVVAQAVNEVVAQRGVSYFSSAGNYADASYENATPRFVTPTGSTKRLLNFDASNATTDVTQRITLTATGSFQPFLQWSDPFYTAGGVQTDLDMYLVAFKNGAPADTVARSTTTPSTSIRAAVTSSHASPGSGTRIVRRSSTPAAAAASRPSSAVPTTPHQAPSADGPAIRVTARLMESTE